MMLNTSNFRYTYNFYQSKLWKYINEYIYLKPVIYIGDIQVIIKNKYILGINTYRAQILGYEGAMDSKSLYDIYNQISQLVSGVMIYMQIGSIEQIYIDHPKHQSDHIAYIYNRRHLDIGKPAMVENMPNATHIIDLSQHHTMLYPQLTASHRNHISKATRKGCSFHLASNISQREEFYDLWATTASDKGFHIIAQDIYISLAKYLIDYNLGYLAICRSEDGDMIGGAIILSDEYMLGGDVQKVAIYLYGCTNRRYGNIGINHFLHRNIIIYAQEHGYDIYDMLGISSVIDRDDHHLSGVTKFKKGFGGIDIEYIGNMDIIGYGLWNNIKYNLYRYIR